VIFIYNSQFKSTTHDTIDSFESTLGNKTGWIFIGYIDEKKSKYIKGPFAEVLFRTQDSKQNNLLPGKGDIFLITKPREIVIARFKEKGNEHVLSPPAQIHSVLDEGDYTGTTINLDELVQVEDINLHNSQDQPYAVWCRIRACDKFTPQCNQALERLP